MSSSPGKNARAFVHHPLRSQSPIIRLFFPYRNPSVKSPDGDPLTGDALWGIEMMVEFFMSQWCRHGKTPPG